MHALIHRSLRSLPRLGGVLKDRDGLRGEVHRLRGEVAELRGDRPRTLQPIVPSACTVRSDEQALLRKLVEETNGTPGPIVEIGTLLGVTTTNLALWATDGRTIVTVDNFGWNPWGLTSNEHRELTAQMLYFLTQTGRVKLVVMGKNEFYETYRGPAPSLVFADAIHTYGETKLDLAWAKRVGAKMIAGHDYSDEFPGVIQAVDEAGGPSRLAGSVFCL